VQPVPEEESEFEKFLRENETPVSDFARKRTTGEPPPA
jgi:hypothetical protein